MKIKSLFTGPFREKGKMQGQAEKKKLTMCITSILMMVIFCSATTWKAGGQSIVFPGESWQEATPESQGINSTGMMEAINYFNTHFGEQGAWEFVIVRNGYLIYKSAYCNNYHNIFSSTKNFTSTVLGLMVDDGRCSLDDLAVKHDSTLDDQYPGYGLIKLRHLASMSAGYKGEVTDGGNPMSFLNPVAPIYTAGAHVDYNDHDVVLLGSILTQIAGESLKSVFKRRVADPIGMAHWDWGILGEIDGITFNNPPGNPYTTGIETTALDLARFGLLYLNKGNWNGQQILSASFVDEAMGNQVPAAGRSTMLWERYGFYWWLNTIRPNNAVKGQRAWPSAPPKTATTLGKGGNYCFVIPEWNMVVVRTGTVGYGSSTQVPSSSDASWEGFFSRLAQAMLPNTLSQVNQEPGYRLYDNFPDPVKTVTTVKYHIPLTARAQVTIFDIRGRHVKSLIDQEQQPGEYTLEWHGQDDSGNPVPDGIYFYQLIAGQFVQTKKMILHR